MHQHINCTVQKWSIMRAGQNVDSKTREWNTNGNHWLNHMNQDNVEHAKHLGRHQLAQTCFGTAWFVLKRNRRKRYFNTGVHATTKHFRHFEYIHDRQKQTHHVYRMQRSRVRETDVRLTQHFWFQQVGDQQHGLLYRHNIRSSTLRNYAWPKLVQATMGPVESSEHTNGKGILRWSDWTSRWPLNA